ncbi:hypothetical protein ACJ72_04138, partial [Emergomyces africanus]
MHYSNLLIALSFAILWITAISSPAPMEQTEQIAQTTFSIQSQPELQELLSQQGPQDERCIWACYPQKPICNGSGA